MGLFLMRDKFNKICASLGIKLEIILLISIYNSAAKLLDESRLESLNAKFNALFKIVFICIRRRVPLGLLDLYYLINLGIRLQSVAICSFRQNSDFATSGKVN